jgi:lysosomal-associated transmembrane protein
LHILALSIIAVVFIHPEVVEPYMKHASKHDSAAFTIDVATPGPDGVYPPRAEPDTHQLHDYTFTIGEFFHDRKFNSEDVNVGLVITFCTFVITVMLMYGAIRGRPSYLLPFFCLQVFDFFVATLTMLGYLSYISSLKTLIAENRSIPFQQTLMEMDPQWLSLVVLVVFVSAVTVKAYFLLIVWNCYKYLCMVISQQSSQFLIGDELNHHHLAHTSADSESFLPPEYEAVIKDPHYLTKMPLMVTPPPPYSEAVPTPAVPAPQQSTTDTTQA